MQRIITSSSRRSFSFQTSSSSWSIRQRGGGSSSNRTATLVSSTSSNGSGQKNKTLTSAVQTLKTQFRIQKDMQRNISTTVRLALGNELSSQRFQGALIGLEDSIERGWDVNGDDDGG